jgi:hypothetical protein
MPRQNTMVLIDKLVADLPPFPLMPPLPDLNTGRYHRAPCATPRARYFPHDTCHCGFGMGEHLRVIPAAMREAAE